MSWDPLVHSEYIPFTVVRIGLVAMLVAGACSDGKLVQGETSTDIDVDVSATPPDQPNCETPKLSAPTILSPENAAQNVVGTELTMALGGEWHRSSATFWEVEIWKDSGGQATRRVWSARLDVVHDLDHFTLADGTFVDDTNLKWGKRYRIRARSGQTRATCTVRSSWSAVVTFDTMKGDDYLFDSSRIHSFYLDIPPESFALIDGEAGRSRCGRIPRTYRRGSLRFEDQVLESVGIRAKGGCGSSRASTDNDGNGKTPFKVKIEWDDPDVSGCPARRTFMNLKRLTFNNAVTDPTLVRERLTGQLYRALGIANSRTTHVRLYVNDVYWGLYVLVETIDRRMLARHFASKEGMLYEGAYLCDLFRDSIPDPTHGGGCLEQKFNAGPCDDPPEPGADPLTNEPLHRLIDDVEQLSSSADYLTDLGRVFDTEAFLNTWAVEIVTGNWDNYQRAGNNYRVYHDPVPDRWTIITSGFDKGWDGGVDPWDNLERQNGGATKQIYLLGQLCLEDPRCEAALVNAMLAVVQHFEQTDYRTRLASIYEQIRGHVYEDPRKETDDDTFDRAVDRVDRWIRDRPENVRRLLRSRNLLP